MTGKPVRVMHFGEVLTDINRRHAEQEAYVKATGKCFACKKNPVVPDGLRCQSCLDRTEEILKQLRGPGFAEVRVPTRKTGRK
jgi:hypothetical protein